MKKRKGILSIFLAVLILPLLGQNVGIQVPNPQEKLDINGAIILRAHQNILPQTGTVEFDGTNFRGFNGLSWLTLDFQGDNDWFAFPNPIPGGREWIPDINTPANTVGITPVSLNPGAWLYVNNQAEPMMPPQPPSLPHMLMLQDAFGFDASMAYQHTDLSGNIFDYSMGILAMGTKFQINENPILQPGTYGDRSTHLRIHSLNPASPMPSRGQGIVDLPNQARARAWMSYNQVVRTNVWYPLEFDMMTYDEHMELTLAPGPMPVQPLPQPFMTNAFYTAQEEGFVQVNARLEIILDSIVNELPVPFLPPGSFVTMGIFTNIAGAIPMLESQGNILQISTLGPQNEEFIFQNNNAPNVKDVIYLQKGTQLSIWIYVGIPGVSPGSAPLINLKSYFDPGEQPFGLPPLTPHPAKVYFSVHKIS